MAPKRLAPFGTWKSPITPALLCGDRSLEDVAWDTTGETVVWLEGRSGRGVLLAQGPGRDAPRELTREKSVRAEVGYGGGDFSVHQGRVYFVAQGEGRIYRVALAGGSARPITPAHGRASAPALSPDGRWVVYVHHDDDGVDRLAIVDSAGEGWPRILVSGADFYMQPRWSPDGRSIAFVAWDHPYMPWDASTLQLATVSFAAGMPRVEGSRIVAGGEAMAVFQPEFILGGRGLAYVSDETGWGHLWAQDLTGGEREQITFGEAEYGRPAWVQGMRSYAIGHDGAYAICARSVAGVAQLERVRLQGGESQVLSEVEAYTDVAQVASSPTAPRFAFVGSAPSIPSRVVACDLDAKGVHVVARASMESLAAGALAATEPVSWDTVGGEQVYGLYVAPHSDRFEARGKPPLVVLVHGGPTDQARAGWNMRAQFFATRGFAVLCPNYRGSTGYGRAYMERLRGGWGVLDVEDAVSGARHLAARGLVDGGRSVIAGGSAGGYTVLMAMVSHPDAFRAGLCYYGVSDLFSLARDTHKFEAHYLDSIVGPLPQSTARYRERSPVLLADRIRRPLAVFQGSDDKAVPPAQSEAIVRALAKNGVPHVYHRYDGEGHGFRRAETVAHFYAAIEAFLGEHLA